MFRTFALAVAAALAAAPALADWQPSGPIKLMIAFRAGGGADTQARLIAEGIEAKRGWKIIPENVTGKGGVVLAQQLKDEPADGLTIAMAVTETLSYNRLAQRDPGFAPEDFTLLTATAGSQMAVVATADKGWKTLGDVIAAAKAGESVSFGAMSPKLADGAYLIGKANGVDFNIVGGLKGGRGVMNALTAGDVDVGWGAGIQTAGVVAGDLVNLASAEGAPLNASPDAPLLEEFGVPYLFGATFVMFAPAGLPDEARAALTEAIVEVVEDPQSKANAFITRAFSLKVVAGADLEAQVAQENADAEAILDAAQ